MIHFLFEQTHTFTNAAKKLGFDAKCYDIAGNPSVKCDLFLEIDKAFNGTSSIFDNMETCDIVFAFFPCTYFSQANAMIFSGVHNGSIDIDDLISRSESRHLFYVHLLKLVKICYRKNLKLVVENPSTSSFLTNNLPCDYVLNVSNRNLYGDYYKKPTYFIFFNWKPTDINLIKRPIYNMCKITQKNGMLERSKLSPEFAENVLRTFILGNNVSLTKQYSLSL